MLYANYHTHTYRCGHAGHFRDEEYIQAAVESGYQVLGFADHAPWPYVGGIPHANIRMRTEQLMEYIKTLQALKEQYWDQIHVYIGLECEYYPIYLFWLKEQKKQLDYLILGNHWSPSEEHGEVYCGDVIWPEQIADYTKYTVEGMETGFFRYIAHPDMVFANYPVFDHFCEESSYKLCETAKKLQMPLEYNLNGLNKKLHGMFKGCGYPCEDFWRIAAKVGCSAIIGCDAHRPWLLNEPERVETARRYFDQLGMNLLNTLEGLE